MKHTLGHDDIIHDYGTMYLSVNVSGWRLVRVWSSERNVETTGLSVMYNVIVCASACVVKDIDKVWAYVGADEEDGII